MGPWEDMNSLVNRATVAGRTPVTSQLGDSAYASAEAKPNFFQSRTVRETDFEDRRRTKRAQLMQSILDNVGAPPPCKRCDLFQNKMMSDRKLFYQEIEHMRRACHKMLDQCSTFMSTGAFLHLRESLQLGVRFLTEHAEGEMDTPAPVSYSVEGGRPPTGEKDKELQEMQQTISKLEDEVQQLEKENSGLKKELAMQKVSEGRLSRASTVRTGTAKQSVDVQTDPVFIGNPDQRGGRAAAPGEPSWEASHEDDRGGHRPPPGAAPPPGSAHRSRPAGGGRRDSHHDVGDDGGDSDDGSVADEAGGTRKKAGKRKKATEKPGSKGSDLSHLELSRAKDELEQLRKKLAEKDRQILEEQRKAAAAEAQAAQNSPGQTRVEVITIPGEKGKAGAADPDGGARARPSQVAAAAAEEKEKSKKGSRGHSTPSKEHGKSRGPGHSNSSSPRPSERSSSKLEPGEARASVLARQELSTPKMPPKPEMVDKCVGGGPPDPVPEGPPQRVRGRSVCAVAPDPPVNRTGVCFHKSVRSEPTLGGSLSASLLAGATSSPRSAAAAAVAATAACMKGGASASGSQPARSKQKSGGTYVVGGGGAGHELGPGSSKFSGDLGTLGSTHSLGASAYSWSDGHSAQSWRGAEPYLLQVWEQRPQGHKKPSQKELLGLGALVPSPPQLGC